MTSTVLKKQISKRISELSPEDNSIVVIKGIPLEIVDDKSASHVTYDQIPKNKLNYLLSIYNEKRQFLTYEEFLLLNELVISQYSTIYILNNNIYMDQYPLNLYCSEEIRNGLLTHFRDSDADENEHETIGPISEFTALFVGLREFNGYLLGAYNDEKILSSPKVEIIPLFPETNESIQRVSEANTFIDIIEEADYISLVKRVLNEPDEITIRISNYTGDQYKLTSHLQILATYWKEQTDVYILQTQKLSFTFDSRSEFTEILKKYWGYSTFRQLPVYDMAKLEEGKKEVIRVSQESIISNLVQQVENCADESKDFRDVFVTAPTGAGKSVMFQIPAIYLAERYGLLTIVISPLIGLMNDQVKNLEVKNYKAAKTINSDISPIIKHEIMEKVASSQYHILYISPETLLSRSDVEQLIGDRTIGMIIIDEAHIVTTWGKQFRPDYWYLGDHIKKLRKKQLEKKGRSFIISTFTATAIYHGVEDMYTETINSLHMLNPITYLGYVKRSDINIAISQKDKSRGQRSEYELDKHSSVEKLIQRVLITRKKTLIYFPTVALIDRCYEYLRSQRMISQIAIYHGSLNKDQKIESYEKFYNNEKIVMLATKAFGMGIDINDIEIVAHFAPTGNVCDYVQEIGRAARREDIIGEACYQYDSRDFKHINRLHGLSVIQKYQLIEVIRKIDELYSNSLKSSGRNNYTRRRNAMLLDAENFTYIFGSPVSDEDNSINKVKTALLIIQKDFENKIGFSPINVRPIPLFSIGFFEIPLPVQKQMLMKYPDCLEEIEPIRHICRVNLDKIWRRNYTSVSFPKFKFMLYSKDRGLDFVEKYPMNAALCVTIDFKDDYYSKFNSIWHAVHSFINKKVISGEHTAVIDIVKAVTGECGISYYKALAICEVIIASMQSYRRNFAKGITPIAIEKTTTDGKIKYQFNVAVNSYFKWVEQKFQFIIKETKNGDLYLINDGSNRTKEVAVILGILEALDILSFKMIGGANSQLYIYVNQIQSLKNILNNPNWYDNRLLDSVGERHMISVKMLTYIYESKFSSNEIWDILEDYFLGSIPEKVIMDCKNQNPNISFN